MEYWASFFISSTKKEVTISLSSHRRIKIIESAIIWKNTKILQTLRQPQIQNLQIINLLPPHRPRSQIFHSGLPTLSHIQRIRQIPHSQHINSLLIYIDGPQHYYEQIDHRVEHVEKHKNSLLLPASFLLGCFSTWIFRYLHSSGNNSSHEHQHVDFLFDKFQQNIHLWVVGHRWGLHHQFDQFVQFGQQQVARLPHHLDVRLQHRSGFWTDFGTCNWYFCSEYF